VTAALALLQEIVVKTPDTSGYMRLGYVAILGALTAYALFLCARARRARKDRHAQ
jgi:hypothetical protein